MSEDFLDVVYGDRPGWIDLPAKVGKYWAPCNLEWPSDGAMTRRIDSCLRDGEDLYYSVTQFHERGRRIGNVMPSAWLWADLDEVHPTVAAKLGYLPTISVESSPGRYQALWRLTKELEPSPLSKLNKALTYALGADYGGWDLTQVLRLPGTRNFKYEGAPFVRLLSYNPDLAYDPSKMWKKLKEYLPTEEINRAVGRVQIPKKTIPRRARELLKAAPETVVQGERSDRLWELECLLAESGLSEDAIFDLVAPTPWNKWAGLGTARERLMRDVRKAVRHVGSQQAPVAPKETQTTEWGGDDGDRTEEDRTRGTGGRERSKEAGSSAVRVSGSAAGDEAESPKRAPFVNLGTLVGLDIRRPRWGVEEILGTDAQGFIAGEPKTSKSLLSLALGISVASGEDFLGEFRVRDPGPVVMVDNETGKRTIQDRARRIGCYMGLLEAGEVKWDAEGGVEYIDLPGELEIDFTLLTDFGFNLTVPEHWEMLVAEIEEHAPKLLILDPFYLMLGNVNENQTKDLRPILAHFSQLRAMYGMSVLINHHFSKVNEVKKGVRPGQRMSGNWALHGWSSNTLFCEAKSDDRPGWTRVRVEREFRAAGPRPPIELAWAMEEEEGVGMDWEVIFDLVSPKRQKADASKMTEMVVKLQGPLTWKELSTEVGRGRDALERYVQGNPNLHVRVDKSRKGKPQVVYFQP